jgi:hypothetical protein
VVVVRVSAVVQVPSAMLGSVPLVLAVQVPVLVVVRRVSAVLAVRVQVPVIVQPPKNLPRHAGSRT